MPIKPHPNFNKIKEDLQALAARGAPFSAVCYRCTERRFANDLVSGKGSQIHGARWNPKESFPAVYLCDTVEAALQEYLARARRMKLPDYKALPMVMAGVKVTVANLLDTTQDEVAAVVKTFLRTEKGHWRARQNRQETASQAIGRAIKEICFSGLIASSQALPEGSVIVLFPEKLKSRESLSVLKLSSTVLK